MQRKNKRMISVIALILAILMILGMVVLPAISANASSLGDLKKKYAQLEQKQKQVQSELNKNSGKKASQAQKVSTINSKMDVLSAQVGNVNAQISTLDSQIGGLNTQIGGLNTQIATKQKLIVKTQKSIDYNYTLFQKRLIALYKTGEYSYLDVLLSASDITDYLYKTQLLKSVTVHDTNLLSTLSRELKTVKSAKAQLVSDKNTLLTKKAQVVSKQKEQQAARAKLKVKQNDLQGQYSEEMAMLGKLKNKGAALKALDDQISRQMDQTDQEIDKLTSGDSGGTYTGGDFLWPIQGMSTRISSPYGYRVDPVLHKYRLHAGIDIAGSGRSIANHPISAANSGTVKFAGNTGNGYGNYIILNHGGGIMTLYGHCSRLAVSTGQSIKRGQIIGYVGETGFATGYHLHFGVYKNGSSVNPLSYTYANRK